MIQMQAIGLANHAKIEAAAGTLARIDHVTTVLGSQQGVREVREAQEALITGE